jgi:hypothetical protein
MSNDTSLRPDKGYAHSNLLRIDVSGINSFVPVKSYWLVMRPLQLEKWNGISIIYMPLASIYTNDLIFMLSDPLKVIKIFDLGWSLEIIGHFLLYICKKINGFLHIQYKHPELIKVIYRFIIIGYIY